MEPKTNFFDLKAAIENLVAQIQRYESDTFSASESGINRVQAEQMAAWLICAQFFDPEGVPGEAIDGAVLGLAFDNVVEHQQSLFSGHKTIAGEEFDAALWGKDERNPYE